MSDTVLSENIAAPDWYLYMVRCRDGSLYTGIATDVDRRLAEHRRQAPSGAKYLRGRGPIDLVFRKKIGNRSLAQRVESKLKKLPKKYKEELLITDHRLNAIIERFQLVNSPVLPTGHTG